MVKLCADTAMQIDVDDALRGHVFAVQDALFWVSFIVAITLAATVIPADGHAPAWSLAGSAVYLAGWRCTPRSAAARYRHGTLRYGDGRQLEPIGRADLRAESDDLDALVAALARRIGWADADAGAGVDDRPPDRAPAVDRPRRR